MQRTSSVRSGAAFSSRGFQTLDVVAEQRLALWKDRLAGAPAALELPTDRPRPAVKQRAIGKVGIEVERSLADRVRALCTREAVTPSIVLLTIFQSVLSRWSGQADVVVGAPLPMRATFDAATSFADALRSAKAEHSFAENHVVPFEAIVDARGVDADSSRAPLFQVAFGWKEIGAALDASELDLALVFDEDGDIFRGSVAYDVALFDAPTIERFVEHFVTFLEAASSHPEERVARLALMTEAEKHRVLVAWNATERSYEQRCAHELFEDQVRRTPDAPAVAMGATTLTYAELNRRANRIAHYLRSHQVAPGSRVALCGSRSLDTVSAVLGILKSGAAYVPIDPSYPAERIELMLADVEPSALVTEGSLLAGALPRPESAVVVSLDGDREAIGRCSDEDPQVAVPDGSGCYVVFTSGSTGRPKGVMMAHRPLVNLLFWQAESAVLRGGVTLQFSPLSFDVSFQELFSTWMHGGKLVLVSEETRRDPSELLDLLDTQRVERLFLPFVALKMLAQAAVSAGKYPRSLKCVVTAGEQLLVTPEIVELFARLDGCILHNHYGPSETHVVTAETLSGPSSEWPKLPAIGRAIANTTLYVLDREHQPVPIGVAGELHLGGVCLADGYFDRPELTAEPSRPLSSWRPA